MKIFHKNNNLILPKINTFFGVNIGEWLDKFAHAHRIYDGIFPKILTNNALSLA